MPTIHPIALHVFVVGDDGSVDVFPSGTGASTVDKLAVELNQHFAPVGLQFTFDSSKDLEEIRQTKVNDDYPVAGDLSSAMAREHLARKNSQKLTLFFRSTANQVAANFSGPIAYYVVLHKGTLTDARKLVHELGHYFHLSHTFSNEPLKEEVEEEIRRYVQEGKHPAENGLQALEKTHDGDRENVGDTPFDLGAKIYSVLGMDPCASDATITLKVRFKDWKSTHPNIETKDYVYTPENRDNWMSYFGGCNFPHSFSEQQKKVIKSGLLKGNRIRLLKGSSWESSNQQDFVSPAAVSRRADTVAVFATSVDGVIMTKVWDQSRDSYWPSDQGWFSLGGTGTIYPVAISRKPDVVDLVARDLTGKPKNKVWTEAKGEYFPSNEGWLDIGPPESSEIIDSKPELISRVPSVLEVFARHPDGSVRRQVWDSTWMQEWENLGGCGVGSLAAVTRRKDIIDVYCRWNDGTVRSKVWRAAQESWWPGQTAWFDLGGRGFDSPAVVARRSDKIDLFIRWDDGTIRSKVWDDSRGSYWPSDTDWFNLGGAATSKPVAVCRNSASIALFTRWKDGSVRIKVWDDARDSWWPNNTDWSNLGGNIVGAPAAVARSENRVVVYARWSDDTIRTKVWNGESGEWWPGQTSWHSLGKP